MVLISDITQEVESEKKRKKQLMTTVTTLGSLFEQRDFYTSGHQKRVANLAKTIAIKMGIEYQKI